MIREISLIQMINKTTMSGPVVMASSASNGHESVFAVSSSTRAHHPELEQLAATMPTATIDASVRSQSRMSISHAKGLLNRPGQNNCFMNSAVQVLWHLDIFRRSFRELRGHACMGDSCIFCALKELFNQFQSSKESALPPDSLRFALAEAFSDQRRFQMGFMDDAAECFENILMRIHYHLTNQEVNDAQSPQCQPHCIPHQKFAMNLIEQIACHACGETSEPLVFSQMVHYASTTALCSQAKLFNSDSTSLSFGSLLKLATSMGDIRNCPKMCGTRISIRKELVNRPDVISVGLVWDSEHPTLTLIRSVFQLIQTTIQLDEVFDLNCASSGEQQQRHQLNLVGLVTYYGKHYSTYLYNSQLAEWIYFDDATVRVIGPSWSQVVDKCLKGHFQPLLLLYANPNGTAVNTEHAFSENVSMTAIKKAAPSEPTAKQCSMASSTAASHFDQIRKVSPVSESYLEQVPDSPSATSTTSYFSDIGDSTDGYISRKAVESILKIQQHNKKKSEQAELMGAHGMFNKRQNRNSSSSLESFDSANALRMSSLPRNHTVESQLISCSLQRRDSGNSSGDRSSSVSSVDTPFYSYRRPLKNGQQKSSKHSDQGYDSFSVSSSDSYPSAATSPSKLTGHKLKQIPEDVHLLEMINASARNECDHLFAEMEILLRKSYDKEREGDLRAAAALADSAASKARIAMDAPYSNHHTLISAKMKYSMCVMRSTGLHRRIQEAEVEERRMMKAVHEYHHSRQSSRDSSHGKHSRQGSRDGKDPRVNAVSPSRQQQQHQIVVPTDPAQNVEIYATLPKRSKRKSVLKTSNGNLTTEETSCQSFGADERSTLPKNSILQQLQKEQMRPAAVLLPNTEKNASTKCRELPRESDFSDYYSEWEGTKRRSALEKAASPSNSSGWQSCRENDSEVYGEISHTGTVRKQCKVRRKLLLGGLLKTKNRSLPDLSRDESLLQESKPVSNSSQTPPVPANIHRGFPLATVGSRGSNRPALVKVKPPLIGEIAPATAVQQKERIYENISQLQFASSGKSYAKARTQTPPPRPAPSRPQPPVPPPQQVKPLESEPLEPVPQSSTNPFLLELNKKRMEILSKRRANETNLSQVQTTVAKSGPLQWSSTGSRPNASLPVRKPSTREIANFISRTAAASTTGSTATSVVTTVVSEMNQRMAQLSVQQSAPKKNTLAVDSTPVILMPIAVHANLNNNPNNNSGNRPVRPPDYETAMRRLEMRHSDQRNGSGFPPPPLPPPSSRPLSPQTTVDQGMPKLARRVSSGSSVVDSVAAAVFASKPMRRKKKVSFSDQIEWVACAGDDPEVHLPNPLLEKVLSNKHVVYTLQ